MYVPFGIVEWVLPRWLPMLSWYMGCFVRCKALLSWHFLEVHQCWIGTLYTAWRCWADMSCTIYHCWGGTSYVFIDIEWHCIIFCITLMSQQFLPILSWWLPMLGCYKLMKTVSDYSMQFCWETGNASHRSSVIVQSIFLLTYPSHDLCLANNVKQSEDYLCYKKLFLISYGSSHSIFLHFSEVYTMCEISNDKLVVLPPCGNLLNYWTIL